jgi:hypothetical protein
MGKNGKCSKTIGGCNHIKGKDLLFAGIVIHNPKVGGSIPPPATNFLLILNNLKRLDSFNSNPTVSNLCPEQTVVKR